MCLLLRPWCWGYGAKMLVLWGQDCGLWGYNWGILSQNWGLCSMGWIVSYRRMWLVSTLPLSHSWMSPWAERHEVEWSGVEHSRMERCGASGASEWVTFPPNASFFYALGPWLWVLGWRFGLWGQYMGLWGHDWGTGAKIGGSWANIGMNLVKIWDSRVKI